MLLRKQKRRLTNSLNGAARRSPLKIINAMKKFFIISVLAAIFGLTSCTGEGDNIVGTWDATKMSMKVEDVYMTVDIAETGMDMELTFKRNGKGTWIMSDNSGSEGFDFDYTLNGARLTISAEGESLSFPITITGDDMTMEFSKDMLDTDYPATLHFVRK